MTVVLIFGLALLAAVLFSGLAHRSVLSTAVLFLVVGIVAGEAGLDVVHPDDEALTLVAELALFSVLFTDGMRLPPRDLWGSRHLPARALLVGLPLTLLVTAALAWGLTGLAVVPALLLAAILTPTDPVFASAIVGREEIPLRLRRLLNVESGLNDGLALPIVVVLVAAASDEPAEPLVLAGEAIGGLALGAAVGVAVGLLLAARWTTVTEIYDPLATVAVAVIVYGGAGLLDANEFLAAFAAGVAVAAMRERASRAMVDEQGTATEFDETVAELLKLAALLTFGALLSLEFLRGFTVGDVVFVVASLLIARPAALAVALWRSGLTRREWLTAAWFGPKGFASVVYALLVLHAGLPTGDEIFHLAGAVVALSIVAHSSTDVLIARTFARLDHHPAPDAPEPDVASSDAPAVRDGE